MCKYFNPLIFRLSPSNPNHSPVGGHRGPAVHAVPAAEQGDPAVCTAAAGHPGLPGAHRPHSQDPAQGVNTHLLISLFSVKGSPVSGHSSRCGHRFAN